MKAAVIAVVVVLILVGGWLIVYVGFSGGIESVIRNRKAAPDPSDLNKERARALKTLESESEKAVEGSSFTYFAQGKDDTCYRGQNNFKVQAGYAHRCSLTITRFYGFNGDFRRQFLESESRLRPLGWVPKFNRSAEQTLRRYFDPNYRKPNRRTGEIYLVSNLPTPRYEMSNLGLSLVFAERQTKRLSALESVQTTSDGYQTEYRRTRLVDIEPLFQKITSDYEYVLAVSIETKYFEN